ncbi:unnamed protein product [Paramecium pentaurelia]|uniref:Uncharacterized protein n=1 Tax=Paramecium pentaurelia TaxID=43138 RepID=A0A8S1V0H2_9CILI|nr:unnamed protein product [Paramecium pentaurelia]
MLCIIIQTKQQNDQEINTANYYLKEFIFQYFKDQMNRRHRFDPIYQHSVILKNGQGNINIKINLKILTLNDDVF